MNQTMEQRFWAKVDTTGDCWMWTAATNANGYGLIGTPSVNGRNRSFLAHRYSAMLHFGMFDTRLKVCHRCDVPGCVRPGHLFLGTVADNNRDSFAKGRMTSANGTKTHCLHGHEFTPDNTRVDSGNRRKCRKCDVEKNRRYNERKTLRGES